MKVLVLRVLKSVLPISKSMDLNTKTALLKRIFKIMGTRILMLIKDPSIENDGELTNLSILTLKKSILNTCFIAGLYYRLYNKARKLCEADGPNDRLSFQHRCGRVR